MKTPNEVLESWIAAVNCHDIDSLTRLYAKNAVLIPTFSSRLLNKPETIREYFDRLCQRDRLLVTLHPKPLMVQNLEFGKCALSGVYCWHFAIDGEPFSFEARFSYFFDLAESAPIIHHHSSQIPRTI